MAVLYNIGITAYYIIILMVSPFNKKAKLWIKGRKHVLKKIKPEFQSKDKTAWFHVSSLGEFEQGRPILEAFKQAYPDFKILLTFFSPSGYEIRKNYEGADYICYLPLDTPYNANKFINAVNPEFVFFVKYDFWFHLLKKAKLSGARLFLISGIFRKKQVFFKWYGKWYRKLLHWFEYLFVQNEESVNLLETIGISNVSLAGDSRFDRVVQIAENSKNIEIAEGFTKGKKTIVCGSTWPEDEEFLIRYIKYNTNIKLILAPHEINKSHIESIIKILDTPYQLYSEADANSKLKESRVLIIDNIGMLSSLYKYGDIAYIGGGFGAGIHNTLEAAVYGIPILFGPNYIKFQEAIDLISCKGGISFNSYNELKSSLDILFNNKQKYTEAGDASEQYVKAKTGATEIVLNYLKQN